MRSPLLDLLVCPNCLGSLRLEISEGNPENVLSGDLSCLRCTSTFPIIRGIPRFVDPNNYGDSFGLQWQTFATEQLDSYNGTRVSRGRWESETQWRLQDLEGEWILDAGCGAGRFLEAAAGARAQVVGVDLSAAVEAAWLNVGAVASNVHIVQADLLKLPFRPRSFDRAYSIGVVQHTPSPEQVLSLLPSYVRDGGEVAITCYERKWYWFLNGKYLARRVTTRLPPARLLRWLDRVVPALFPVVDRLFSLPLVGRVFAFVLPVANFRDVAGSNRDLRRAWAVMDTFDMLAPAYDSPQTFKEVRDALAGGGATEIRRLPNPGVNVVASVRRRVEA